MAKIEAALPSPRITNGIIAWYCMDEFEIGLSIKLYDADGEEISLGNKDETILFDVGTYFYDIRILGKYNRTIVKNNIIKVE